MSTAGGPRLEGTNRGHDMLVCLDATMLSATSSLPVKSGLMVWLDAADDDSFDFGSGTTVSKWRDKTGNGYDVSQSTASYMPNRIAYTGTTVDPCFVVDFDGNDDSLSSSATLDLTTTGIYTQIIVWSCDVASSDAGLITINNSLGSGITAHAGSTVYRYYGGGGYNLSSGSLSTGTFYITGKVFPGAGGSVTRVAFQDGTRTTNVGATSLGNASGVLRLGQSSTYLNGKIAEVLIYNRVLSNGEMAWVNSYLNGKWNISTTDTRWYDLTQGTATFSTQSGELTNDAAYSVEGRGSIDYDGTDDQAYINWSTPFTTAKTWACWFYLDSIPSSSAFDSMISSTNNWNSTSGISLQLIYGNFTWSWGSNWTGSCSTPTSVLSTGVWYHFTGTSDGTTGTGKIKMYLNGELEDTGTAAQIPTDTPSTIKIGNGSGGSMDGRISTFQVFRDELSAAEVKANFNTLRNRFKV